MSDQTSDNTAQRLARLEQMATVLAEAEKTRLAALQQVQQQVATLERNALAGRMFGALATASEMFPKDKSVVFVGREYVGDNIKYAFLAFMEQAASLGIACHFLADNEKQYRQWTDAGLPCFPVVLADWTTEHVRTLLAAKVAVLCNIFRPYDEARNLFWSLLRGAKTIQMWHGIPLKEIGFECLFTPSNFSENSAELLAASGPFDIFVGTGAAQKDEWARRFKFNRYEAIGSPRNDVLFREPTARDLINVDMNAFQAVKSAASAGKPIVLYAPTFRDQKLGTWFHEAGIAAFADHCAAKGYELWVNLHPFEQRFLPEFQARYPRLRFLAPQTDLYPVLRYASVLVTDYSSLVFDFLPLDRPVLFYRPDHADYVANSRALIKGHEQYICGPVTESEANLCAAIDEAAAAFKNPAADAHRAKRNALKTRLYDQCDGDAGKRLVELIRKEIEA